MREFLSNAWVIGIGGGILSGIIVTVISRAFFSRRENREYLQRVGAANRDVIYAVRPDISEGLVPTSQVLEALVRATARKFSVNPKDMYHTPEIAEELTKEIMDSSFISSQMKRQYCDQLSTLALPAVSPPADASVTSPEISRGRETEWERYRERLVTMMSMMMGLLVTTMSIIFVLFQYRERDLPEVSDNLPTAVLPMVASLTGMILVFAITYVVRDLQRHIGGWDRLRDKRRGSAESSDETPT